jgi:putative NIF3 family GTP cyclohydrolase 1 type 2
MNSTLLSRRAFAAGMLASTGAAYAAKPATLTPATIVERIRAACAERGVEWQKETVDTFKIGRIDMPVTGVVSTFMATLPVMRKAVALGANFIVSHEPIFYNHLDDTSGLQADRIYQAKVRFATQHGLTVWRFHDHWHKIKPEPMSSASIKELGWSRYLDKGSEGFRRTFTRPETTLRAVAEEIASRYPSASVRVIGRPDLPVRKIVNIGHGVNDVVNAFAIGDIAIGPEVREWDSAELTRDAVMLGANKGLILIAHERGEEGGMELCREWLRPLIPEVRLAYIDGGEPFTSLAP